MSGGDQGRRTGPLSYDEARHLLSLDSSPDDTAAGRLRLRGHQALLSRVLPELQPQERSVAGVLATGGDAVEHYVALHGGSVEQAHALLARALAKLGAQLTAEERAMFAPDRPFRLPPPVPHGERNRDEQIRSLAAGVLRRLPSAAAVVGVTPEQARATANGYRLVRDEAERDRWSTLSVLLDSFGNADESLAETFLHAPSDHLNSESPAVVLARSGRHAEERLLAAADAFLQDECARRAPLTEGQALDALIKRAFSDGMARGAGPDRAGSSRSAERPPATVTHLHPRSPGRAAPRRGS